MEQAKPKYCDAESPVIEGYQIQGSPNNVNNYYTTGGGAHPNINKLSECNNGNHVGGGNHSNVNKHSCCNNGNHVGGGNHPNVNKLTDCTNGNLSLIHI